MNCNRPEMIQKSFARENLIRNSAGSVRESILDVGGEDGKKKEELRRSIVDYESDDRKTLKRRYTIEKIFSFVYQIQSFANNKLKNISLTSEKIPRYRMPNGSS